MPITRRQRLAAAALFLLETPAVLASPLARRQDEFGTCSMKEMTDASTRPNIRWKVTNSDKAFSQAVDAFKNQKPGDTNIELPFPLAVSNHFTGPDRMDCTDVGDTTCNTMLRCQDANSPAGSIVLNSMISVHILQKNKYDGIDTALNVMQSSISNVKKTFLPDVEEGPDLLKALVDFLPIVVGLGSSFGVNSVLNAAKQLGESEYSDLAKDAFSTAVASAVEMAKAEKMTPLDQQNSLQEALGSFMGAWMNSEAAYLKRLFSGEDNSIKELEKLVANGMQLAIPVNKDLASLKDEAQKIAYARIIPQAWKKLSRTAGNAVPPRAFVLVADGECNDNVPEKLQKHFEGDTHKATRVCHDGKILYLVYANFRRPRAGTVLGPSPRADYLLQSLPGGTHDVFTNGAWGGLSIEDMVVSAYEGYKLNGNKIGFALKEDTKAVDGSGNEGRVPFESGVRTPGFVDLPVCDQDLMFRNLKNCQVEQAGFPCLPNPRSTGACE